MRGNSRFESGFQCREFSQKIGMVIHERGSLHGPSMVRTPSMASAVPCVTRLAAGRARAASACAIGFPLHAAATEDDTIIRPCHLTFQADTATGRRAAAG